MDISVVIPVKNRPTVIGRAVASALNQTILPIEVIVVDDGSTDDTPEIVQRLAALDSRIKLIRREQSCGAPSARNIGVSAANGEAVAFLDSDDTWHSEKLEQQSIILQRHPDTPAVYCGVNYIYEVGNRRLARKATGIASSTDLMVENIVGSTSVCVVRRCCFESVGGFDETLVNCEDWDLWLKLSSIAPLRGAPEPLMNYYVSGTDKLSRDYSKLLAGHKQLQERILILAGLRGSYRKYVAYTELKLGEVNIRIVGDAKSAVRHFSNAIGAYPSFFIIGRAVKFLIIHFYRGAQ